MIRLAEVKYTPVEAAALLRVSRRTLDRWATSGYLGVILKPMKLGHYVFYTDPLIAEFQRQCDLRRKRLQRSAKTRRPRRRQRC